MTASSRRRMQVVPLQTARVRMQRSLLSPKERGAPDPMALMNLCICVLLGL